MVKKSLGQNFLVDDNIINKIIKINNSLENKPVLEIGPGRGALTEKILEHKPKELVAIEKDEDLFLFLKEKFKNFNQLKIINNDILNIIKKKNLEKKVIVFGN